MSEEDDQELESKVQDAARHEMDSILAAWKTFVANRNFMLSEPIDLYARSLQREHGYEILDRIENPLHDTKDKYLMMDLQLGDGEKIYSPSESEWINLRMYTDIEGTYMTLGLMGIMTKEDNGNPDKILDDYAEVKLNFNSKDEIDHTVSWFSAACGRLRKSLDPDRSLLYKIIDKAHDTTQFLQLLMLLSVSGTGLGLRTSLSFDDLYESSSEKLESYIHAFMTRPIMCKCCYTERLTKNRDRGTYHLRTFIGACISHKQLEISKLTCALAKCPSINLRTPVPDRDNVIGNEPEFGFFAYHPSFESIEYKHYKSVLRIYGIQAREILRSKGLFVQPTKENSSSSSSSSSSSTSAISTKILPNKRQRLI